MQLKHNSLSNQPLYGLPIYYTNQKSYDPSQTFTIFSNSKPKDDLVPDVIVEEEDSKDQQKKYELLQMVIQKHLFIKTWHRGPAYDERRVNENIFVKDDKILIIEDDELKDDD